MMNWKDRKELLWLHDLARKAPAMTISDAAFFASAHARTFAQMMAYSEALAVLSEAVLGFDKDGKCPKDENRRFAVSWAMQQVQECHASVVCGPVSSGMETLLQMKDEAWKQREAFQRSI